MSRLQPGNSNLRQNVKGISSQRGGRRLKAGRLPQVFHLKKEAARELAILTGERKNLNSCITELEVLEALIHGAWYELDQQYQEAAERAIEGESSRS